jgi:hypothetical protein
VTTASITASLSAINASMNANGNLLDQIKTVGHTTIQDVTSTQSLQNIALAAVVAGTANLVVQVSGGSTSLEKGKEAVYKPSETMIQNNPKYADYNGVLDPSANNIGIANIAPTPDLVGQPITPYSTDPLTSSFWKGFGKEGGFISNSANKVGGMNAMSSMHDPWGQNFIIKQPIILQVTIVPAISIEYCAIAPSACGVISNELINNNKFGTKK